METDDRLLPEMVDFRLLVRRATEDIDASILDALRSAWAAEGAISGSRLLRRRRRRAGMERFKRENPELIRELGRRYRQAFAGNNVTWPNPTDSQSVGLWLTQHYEQLP